MLRVTQLLSPHQLVMFVPAALVMAFLPGQDMLFVIAQGAQGGFRRGMMAAVGTLSAFFVIHITGAAFGLSALIWTYEPLFVALKYTGAVYLFYLGVRAITVAHRSTKDGPAKANGGRSAFWQGFVTNSLNPKIAIFLFAFFPQVVDPSRGAVIAQTYGLGLIWGLSGLLALTLAAWAAGRLRQLRARHPIAQRIEGYVSGAIFLALGTRVALNQR